MKITHILTSSLLILSFVQTEQAAAVNSDEYDFRVLFHLFNPYPQHFAQSRIHAIAVHAHEKEAVVGSYEVAFMKEVRLFLLEEIKVSFLHAAQAQQNPIADDYATRLAKDFLRIKFEEPYKNNTGKELFDANPTTLPEHSFTYCLREYLVPILLNHPNIPTLSRGALDVYGYLHMILIGIDYTRKALDITENMITAAGVTRRPRLF